LERKDNNKKIQSILSKLSSWFYDDKTATTGAHTEHELNTPKLRSDVSQPSGLSPMVNPLTIAVAALLTYFCINAFQRMKELRQQLEL
jgi:hypothetical protein